jgi:N,N'-diacetylchitobiose transport system permease protein
MSTSTAPNDAARSPTTPAADPRGSRRGRRLRNQRRDHRSGSSSGGLVPLLLLSPAGLVVVALTIVPIGFLVFASFTNYDQRTLFTGVYNTVGFSNYTQTLTSSAFWQAFIRTILFTTAMVAGSMVIGMAVSQLLGKVGRGMRYVMTIVLIFAWAMPTVASALVWGWLFEPIYGVLNWLLTQTHLFGNVVNTSWGDNTTLAYICIWLLVVWQAVPFIALTLNAAQTQVDPAYFEAARIDGAGEWRVYWTITMYFLRPTLLLVTILSVIWDFNVFNQIWLISQGGPNGSTATLGVYTYLQAFINFNIGSGAAISIITTALLLILSAGYIRSLLRAGEDL